MSHQTSLLSNKQGYWYHAQQQVISKGKTVMIPFLVTVLTKRLVFTGDGVGVGVVVGVVLETFRFEEENEYEY